ncbi:flagellar hook-associated protein FlgK [uncultured Azonexus sp.]|uniref:flagellar hook-associated protein FlgK n=1 Tax=uncultured Azonexus sp. TaxID=520307 RepID=UPI00262EC915|nr:flagellar hook-associated protein FlgK [uncultured Azonexus sp.]
MGTGLISIGITGIRAAQLGLLATEHNIVNANTPGYSRQNTVQATNNAITTGSGSIGQGVQVVTIKRQYDAYLNNQVNTAQTQVSNLNALYTQLSQIDLMLADPDAGMSPAMQDFFAGVQQVSSNPSSLPARQSMLTSAQTMVTRFNNLDLRLTEIARQLDGRIVSAVADINAYANEIADLNQRIVLAQSGYSQPPNDLLDQRDQLVNELNKLIKVNTSTNSDGSFNVFIGTGQQLVIGGKTVEMTASASSLDLTRIAVGLKTAGGTQELPESLIVGGELGGLVSFRSQSLDAAVNELGRVAASLTLTFNAQYGLGMDMSGRIAGETGFVGELFSVPQPKVVPSATNQGTGALTASFLPPVAPSAPDYAGNFYTNLSNSDYLVTFAAGGNYTVTRQNDGVAVATGTSPAGVQFDGVSLNISVPGAMAGDRFVVKPVAEAAKNISLETRVVADPRLVNAAAPVRTIPAITNTGVMVMSQGVVGVGYSIPATQTLVATATDLTGLTGTWVATYSDGTVSAASTGDIPLTSGTATLSGITWNNMSFSITGAPNTGDRFVIERNSDGLQDGRNALKFAALQTANTTAGGTATYQSTYSRLVAENGIRTREAKVRLAAQEAVLTQAQNARDSLSAVNLDEEAANLMKFQQAYQAAAKILDVGNKMFETLLSIR